MRSIFGIWEAQCAKISKSQPFDDPPCFSFARCIDVIIRMPGSTQLRGNAQQSFRWAENENASFGYENDQEALPPAGTRVDMTSRHMWINEWGWDRANGLAGGGRLANNGDIHSVEVVGVIDTDLSGYKLEFYTAGPRLASPSINALISAVRQRDALNPKKTVCPVQGSIVGLAMVHHSGLMHG